jgi:hypothetical protein
MLVSFSFYKIILNHQKEKKLNGIVTKLDSTSAMNVITKKSPTTTTAATSGTSYLSMMTSNVANNNINTNIKRRESSMAEDSVS